MTEPIHDIHEYPSEVCQTEATLFDSPKRVNHIAASVVTPSPKKPRHSIVDVTNQATFTPTMSLQNVHANPSSLSPHEKKPKKGGISPYKSERKRLIWKFANMNPYEGTKFATLKSAFKEAPTLDDCTEIELELLQYLPKLWDDLRPYRHFDVITEDEILDHFIPIWHDLFPVKAIFEEFPYSSAR